MGLYKTTIVIWSDYNPDEGTDLSIEDIARDAIDGDSYCSRHLTEYVDDPEHDEDWDGTEFFRDPLEP